MEDEIEDGSGEREKLACGTRAEGAPDSVDAVEWNRQTRTRTSGGRRVLNEVYSKAELKKREAFILSQRYELKHSSPDPGSEKFVAPKYSQYNIRH